MSLENFPSFLLNFSETGMNGDEKHRYRFKSFNLDVGERQLLQNDTAVSLTPKAFDVLVCLVERGGHLVEKEALIQSVWPDSFVEESNLARIVHTLRKTLGDDGNGNSFIETVPTKGYRFVADVSIENGVAIGRSTDGLSVTPDAENLEAESTLKNENEPMRPAEVPITRQGFPWAFALLGTALILAAAGWVWFGQSLNINAVGLNGNSVLTLNREAYFNYKEGRLALEKNPGDHEKALEYFDKAIQFDPNLADAYAGRAIVKMWKFASSRMPDDMAQARTSIDRALEINGASSLAQLALCRMKVTYDWEFKKAESACRRAFELDSTNQDARFELAMIHSMFGREEEALAGIKSAIALAPTSLNKRNRGVILFYARRYDEAIEQLRELSEDDPEFAVANAFISRASEMKGDYDTALSAKVKRSQSQGSSPETIEIMRSKYAAQGWPGVLRFIVELPEGLEKSQIGGGAVHLAAMYCQLGEFENAYEALEKGFKQRNPWMIHLGRDPRFDSMRNDARFTELLARIGLK